ncbi:calcium-binding protein [Synechococcus sp. KORDI-100]|uniref:calcium-binding protein n=1 Tax=Synechococcus sp. KORDI-100 TaxID=1280380 RepID=UPI00138E0444|nr:calcium-binding protein [Synechococcus sp. KORDI-100]
MRSPKATVAQRWGTWDESLITGRRKRGALLRDEEIGGTAAADVIDAGDGDDLVESGEGDDDVDGDAGNDSIEAGAGDDSVDGGKGNDTVDGGSGDDSLNGGSGDDLITADIGDDQLEGGKGDDTLEGGKGRDILDGGLGNDILNGGKGADDFILSEGMDKISDFNPKQGDRIIHRPSTFPIDEEPEIKQKGKDVLIKIGDFVTTVKNSKAKEVTIDSPELLVPLFSDETNTNGESAELGMVYAGTLDKITVSTSGTSNPKYLIQYSNKEIGSNESQTNASNEDKEINEIYFKSIETDAIYDFIGGDKLPERWDFSEKGGKSDLSTSINTRGGENHVIGSSGGDFVIDHSISSESANKNSSYTFSPGADIFESKNEDGFNSSEDFPYELILPEYLTVTEIAKAGDDSIDIYLKDQDDDEHRTTFEKTGLSVKQVGELLGQSEDDFHYFRSSRRISEQELPTKRLLSDLQTIGEGKGGSYYDYRAIFDWDNSSYYDYNKGNFRGKKIWNGSSVFNKLDQGVQQKTISMRQISIKS